MSAMRRNRTVGSLIRRSVAVWSAICRRLGDGWTHTMRAKQALRSCVMLLVACPLTAAVAQATRCDTLPAYQREFARAIGACRDLAPIIDIAPPVETTSSPAPPVPNGSTEAMPTPASPATPKQRSSRPNALKRASRLQRQPRLRPRARRHQKPLRAGRAKASGATSRWMHAAGRPIRTTDTRSGIQRA